MLDLASTNKSAIKNIFKSNNSNPLAAFWPPHDIYTVRNNIDASKPKKFMQHITAICNTNFWKAKSMFKVNFRERVKTGGGLRWGIEHEQADKLNQLGAVQFRYYFFKPFIYNKYSGK